MNSKQYGLILPNKNKTLASLGKRKLVALFDSDEELQRSDEESPIDWVESMMKKSVGNASLRATQRRHIKEAQAQDPTVFQYDEIYDDMKSQTEMKKKKLRGDIDKKPKYIGSILKAAAKRKLENERRMERKVQRERDEEGDEFADKDAFVSASFLKKVDELKAAEQEERREMALEELRDVKKHKNFGVFYSHILEQSLGNEEVTIKKEPLSTAIKKEAKSTQRSEPSRKKNYRKRRSYSSDSSSNSDHSPVKSSARNRELKRKSRRYSSTSDSSDSESSKQRDSGNKITSDVSSESNRCKVAPKMKVLTVEERMIQIRLVVAKRTIGDIFEKAVERFFQRRAQGV